MLNHLAELGSQIYVIALIYGIFAVITLISWFNSKGNPIMKFVAVPVMLVIGALTGWILLSSLGNPTTIVSQDDQYQLIAYDVVEPNKVTQDPGKIFLWVYTLELNEDEVIVGKSDAPINVVIPYSRSIHESLEEGEEGDQRGVKFKEEGESDLEKWGDENGNQMEIYDLPPPQAPRKDPT